ncbi:hypothetical protein GCM10010518_35420 [Kitasatospora cinereorecta]
MLPSTRTTTVSALPGGVLVAALAARGPHAARALPDRPRRTCTGRGPARAKNGLTKKWHLPDGGSPDTGGVSADGKVLRLSGRYDAEVYAIDTHRRSARSPAATRPATPASSACPDARRIRRRPFPLI